MIKRTEATATLVNGVTLFYMQWHEEGDHHAAIDKPVVLLVHGSGFVAATFDAVARHLANQFKVIAIDRRGHGASSKLDANESRPSNYEFFDFAEDCIQFCQQLSLHNIYAVGHSAGGTDLLIADSLQPGLFKKLFVMEPTLADPTQAIGADQPTLSSIQERLNRVQRRRQLFPSYQAVLNSYREKDAFSKWVPALLQTYIQFGFVERDDGQVELLCNAATESAILKPIMLAQSNAYDGDHRGNPFPQLGKSKTPIALSGSRDSAPVYQEQTRRAQLVFPTARLYVCQRAGHCAAQEDPKAVANNILHFFFQAADT